MSPYEVLRNRPAELLRDSRFMGFKNETPDLIDDPITYSGGSLRYTSDDDEAMRAVRCLLGTLHALALRHGVLLDTFPDVKQRVAEWDSQFSGKCRIVRSGTKRWPRCALHRCRAGGLLWARASRSRPRAEINLYQDVLDRLECRPHFCLVLAARSPVVPEKIEATLRALAGQAYRDWQLLIVTDATEPTDLLAIADRVGVRDQATSIPADAASGVLVPPPADGVPCLGGVLLTGDELGCNALAEFAVARGLRAATQFFYADEDRVSPTGLVREPFSSRPGRPICCYPPTISAAPGS
jgi:hypothetical protein